MPGRVLVVDDVLPNVKLLEAKLSSEYFDVLSAYDGPEALKVIEDQSPDLVLLDVMMPGMDGFEVCRRIRGNQHEGGHRRRYRCPSQVFQAIGLALQFGQIERKDQTL